MSIGTLSEMWGVGIVETLALTVIVTRASPHDGARAPH
jgi:hypothetical protein